MSAITLKNHINHADGSRNNKINANTTLCPLLASQQLAQNNPDIKLLEINFKAADKINVIFSIQEGNETIGAQFADALLSFNEAVRDKIFPTTYKNILQHSLITTEQVDVSPAVLDAMWYVKLNKGGAKVDKYEAEIQFKKTLQFSSAPATPATTTPKPTTTATTKPTPEQTTKNAPTTTTSATAPTQTRQRPNQHKDQAQIISQHVFNTLFERKTPLDFALLSTVHTFQQELATLQHELSLAKNKEKAAIQQRIDDINVQLAVNQPQYDQLQQQITQAVFQDVVTAANIGYTQGLSSVKKF